MPSDTAPPKNLESPESGQLREYLVGVTINGNLWPDISHRSQTIDEKRRPLDAHIFFAVIILLYPDAVLLAEFMPLIGDEYNVQTVLVAKLGVARDVIGTHTDHDSVGV